MFDLNRSYFNDLKERAVAAGVSITEEGQILAYVDDGAGGLAVDLTDGSNTQQLAGFAITDALKITTETVVEQVVVPAGGGAVNLKNTNIVSGSERVVASTTGVLAENCPTPGAAEYCLDDATGIVTFNVAQAAQTVTIVYRYNLTLELQLNKFHERSINNRAQDFFSSVSVGALEGEIFTSMFDTSVAYSVTDPIYSETGGIVTSAAGGVKVGFVSQVPSVNDGLLGVKFQIPV